MVTRDKRQDFGDEVTAPPVSQGRKSQQRFQLQVDRQTKSAFTTFADAERAGLAIKTAHPIVQVSVYDSVECQRTVLYAIGGAQE
jgi:hypothetical protein